MFLNKVFLNKNLFNWNSLKLNFFKYKTFHTWKSFKKILIYVNQSNYPLKLSSLFSLREMQLHSDFRVYIEPLKYSKLVHGPLIEQAHAIHVISRNSLPKIPLCFSFAPFHSRLNNKKFKKNFYGLPKCKFWYLDRYR